MAADLTSSSFLDQPIEDLVLLHAVNSLLASVALPTLHNILDATPYLLIVLYEALPSSGGGGGGGGGGSGGSGGVRRRRRRIPFVDRKNTGSDFGTRLKNLKLLVGSIAHDETLGLGGRVRKRLADLDLAAFCEKDREAVREVLILFVEIVGGASRGASEAGDSTAAVVVVVDEGDTESVDSSFAGESVHSSPIAPHQPRHRHERAPRIEAELDYGSDSTSQESTMSTVRHRHEHRLLTDRKQQQMGERTPPLPPLPSSRYSGPAVYCPGAQGDETNVSLLPLPPSPPSQTQYLSLKGSDYFSKRPSSRITGQRQAIPSSPRLYGGRLAVQQDRLEPNANSDDDDRTSLVSVSPASWSSDSLYTAALRMKRTDALQRLRRAEGRFQREIRAREDPTVESGVTSDEDCGRGGGEGEEAEEEEEGEDKEEEEEDQVQQEGTLRSGSTVAVGYDDLERELERAGEEDGTIHVEKLEELVKAYLVMRGYTVVGHSAC